MTQEENLGSIPMEIEPDVGDTTNDLMSLKRILATSEWVEEAQQLPLEVLENEEREIVIKCINKDELLDCEINRLEEILGRYREAIVEQKPAETVQAVTENIQHIQDCDTLLEKLDEVRSESITTIPFNIPTKTGLVALELDIYPLTDSSLLLDPNSHFVALVNQTVDNTPSVFETEEQQQVHEHIQQQSRNVISQTSLDEDIETVIELLSNQTSLKGQPRDKQKMEKIYRKLPLFYLAALSQKVQELIVEQVYNDDLDKVFQKIN